jgi:hypothetical protein
MVGALAQVSLRPEERGKFLEEKSKFLLVNRTLQSLRAVTERFREC